MLDMFFKLKTDLPLGSPLTAAFTRVLLLGEWFLPTTELLSQTDGVVAQ